LIHFYKRRMDEDDSATMPPKYKTLSFTHVEYPEGDKLGKLFAVFSLAPIVIAVVLATLFLSRRDLHTLTFGIGVIVNHVLNYFLKQYYDEPRPVQRQVVFEELGMPSNHSQYMWFVCVYLVLFTKYRLHHLGHRGETIWKLFVILATLSCAGVMSYSRVYLQYHTVEQVVWGSVIGAVFALVWFVVTQYLLTPFYTPIANWRISEFFLLRDCSPIPNIMWFEYVNTRGEAHKRKKKERKNQ